MFGSLEGEASRVESSEEESRGELLSFTLFTFLKLRGRIISPSSYLDVLKIKTGMRRDDQIYLNRQIYFYLKIDLQHWSMINLFD